MLRIVTYSSLDSMYKIGYGKDIHALVVGKPLILGSVNIPYLMGLESYSDGDVVIHSLVDAILGALGLGDIGTMFPDDDPKNKGRHSVEFLGKAKTLIDKNNFSISNIDITIFCEKPKLRDYIDEMRTSLAFILGIKKERLNIKACTNEGFGPVGEGKAIEAVTVLLLEKLVIERVSD